MRRRPLPLLASLLARLFARTPDAPRPARTLSLVAGALGIAALAGAASSCAQVLGLDQFFDCPEDPRCPSCSDGKKDGDEADVDCGKGCPEQCAAGKACREGADCASGKCTAGKCEPEAAPTCADGAKNGGETDVDCGGDCPPCAEGKRCQAGADCATLVCGADGRCAAPTCTDGAANGAETDVDCGGPVCGGCGPGKKCGGSADCKNQLCAGGVCTSTCTDGERGGSETDVDCGGGAASGCPACGDGKGCQGHEDCESGVCQAEVCAPYLMWRQGFVGDASGSVYPTGVAVDGGGNVILAGTLAGTVALGGAPLTSGGDSALFVAKYDGAGKHLMSKRFGDGGMVRDLATDQAGNIAITGYFSSTLDFGDNSPIGAFTPGTDAFVAVLSPSGGYLWAASFGEAGTDQSGEQVALRADGSVVVSGQFHGTIDLGGGPLVIGDKGGLFLGSFDPPFYTHTWSKHFDVSYAMGYRMSLTSKGDVIVAMGSRSGNDFGCGPMPHAGDSDVAVARLSRADGHCVWSMQIGDASGQTLQSLAVDASDRIYLAGGFGGSMTVGGTTMTADPAGNTYILVLDENGNHLSHKIFHEVVGWDSMSVTAGGKMMVSAPVGTDYQLGSSTLACRGGYDMFLAEMSGDGDFLWGRFFGDDQDQWPTKVVAYDESSLVTTGTFSGSLDLGTPPLVANAGPQSAFVARVRVP